MLLAMKVVPAIAAHRETQKAVKIVIGRAVEGEDDDAAPNRTVRVVLPVEAIHAVVVAAEVMAVAVAVAAVAEVVVAMAAAAVAADVVVMAAGVAGNPRENVVVAAVERIAVGGVVDRCSSAVKLSKVRSKAF